MRRGGYDREHEQSRGPVERHDADQPADEELLRFRRADVRDDEAADHEEHVDAAAADIPVEIETRYRGGVVVDDAERRDHPKQMQVVEHERLIVGDPSPPCNLGCDLVVALRTATRRANDRAPALAEL